MKKITLSVALLASVLTAKALDTICTMVKVDEVLEFNYQTSKVIDRKNYEGTVLIEVGYREVLCLHLYDGKRRKRKVITIYSDGHRHVERLQSKDDVYYSEVGPLTVEVK